MSANPCALDREIRVCAPVHSYAPVKWPKDAAFRREFDARLVHLGDVLAQSRQEWPSLTMIYADIGAAIEATIKATDLAFRGGEIYVRFTVDASRVDRLHPSLRSLAIEVGLLQALVYAAVRIGLSGAVFHSLLEQRLGEAGGIAQSDLGLPPLLSLDEVRKRSRKPPTKAPALIKIKHDDYHAQYVGRTDDGRQFFLTTPFSPAMEGSPGREYIALYVFDDAGGLRDARIEDLGTRAELDDAIVAAKRSALLESLGQLKYGTIRVAPFRIEKFGCEFGLVAQEPDVPDDDWSVTVEPGDYMAFYPPWNGEYDT
jgi:hypothetical protein